MGILVLEPIWFASENGRIVWIGLVDSTPSLQDPINFAICQSLATEVPCSQDRIHPVYTLPETNSSPMIIGYPKRKLVFQPSIFRCELLVLGRVGVLQDLFFCSFLLWDCHTLLPILSMFVCGWDDDPPYIIRHKWSVFELEKKRCQTSHGSVAGWL